MIMQQRLRVSGSSCRSECSTSYTSPTLHLRTHISSHHAALTHATSFVRSSCTKGALHGHHCRPSSAAAADAAPMPSSTSEDDIVRVATVGDTVTIHFTCTDEQGKVLESSREMSEPLSFLVGAGEVMGNKLFKGFDETVRGMAVGQVAIIKASGGEWRKELLFAIPREHPEILRMEGRYKSQGGLKEGLVVELSNGGLGHVVEMDDQVVKLDANNMLAGKTLTFEIEILLIDKTPVDPEDVEDGP